MTTTADAIERIGSQIRELMNVDVPALCRDDFLEDLEATAKLEKMAGCLASLYAADVKRRSAPERPDGGFARVEGHGNPGKMVATFSGGSVGRAHRSMEAGDAFTPVPAPPPAPGSASVPAAPPSLGTAPVSSEPPAPAMRPKYPLVAQAQMNGDLSVETAAVIVEGLNMVRGRVEQDYLDTMERRFVDKSHGFTAHQMMRVVATSIARVDTEQLVARERRNHDDRYMWWKQDVAGVVTFHGRMDVVTAAPIITALEQLTSRDVRKQTRDEEPDAETRTVGQMRADALHTLARHALGCGAMHRSGIRTTLVVRVTQEDIERRTGLGSIDGIETPVSLESLGMCCGDAGTVFQFVDREGNVLHQKPEERDFSVAQRNALLARDGGCAKCHAPPAHCEAHHITWWSHGGRSTVDNGVMLCTRCHHDVHRYGWTIEVITGHVYFTPPGGDDANRFLGGNAALEIDIGPPRRRESSALIAQA